MTSTPGEPGLLSAPHCLWPETPEPLPHSSHMAIPHGASLAPPSQER